MALLVDNYLIYRGILFFWVAESPFGLYVNVMNDDLEAKLAALRDAFFDTMAARMEEIRSALSALESGDEDAAAGLISVVHKLSGGGGTFSFHLISHLAGDMETLLSEGNRDLARLGRLADGLQTLIDAGGNLQADGEAAFLDALSGDMVEHT